MGIALRAARRVQRAPSRQSVIAFIAERASAGVDTHELAEEAAAAIARALGVEFAAFVEAHGAARGVVIGGTGLRPDALGAQIAFSEIEALGDRVYASGISAVAGDRSRPLALLDARSCAPRDWDDDDHSFLSAAAHILASALERRRVEARARHAALHDRLTGVPNRALFIDRLDQALARLEKSDRGCVTALVLDMDEFKRINDGLGHVAGDELLRQVAERTSELVRSTDTLGRLGGDEFAVLVERMDDDAEDGETIAQAIAARLSEPFVLGGDLHFVSATIGVASATAGTPITGGELLRNADAAAYRAKERGRGRCELFDEASRSRSLARLQLENELRRALERDELCVYYQPYFSLRERALAGVEALVRWRHPERGLLGPGEFVPVAEETGLIIPLGDRVLRQACDDLGRWREEHSAARDVTLSVNLAARQLSEPGLVQVVRDVLDRANFDPGALGLELTEHTLIHDPPAVHRTLDELRALGVRLLLDDFGTGYSSLGYLRRFRMDVLKIDREFVSGLGADEADGVGIVDAIVRMAEALRLCVIAEGVETAAELRALLALGCDYAQGFHLARPLPADELVRSCFA